MGMNKNHSLEIARMKPGFLLAASITLCAMAAGPTLAAEDTAKLPDLSRALQARIDGRMSAALNTRAVSETKSAERAESPGSTARRETTSASGRTDGRGWKPYHSAM